jgi:S1-C subfamily serine protease
VQDVRALLTQAGTLPKDADSGAEVTLSLDRSGQKLLALLAPAPKRVVPPINPELSKAWAGWDVQPIPGTLARQLKLAEPGFRVVRVFPQSPAEKAGIAVGDLIVATNAIAVKPSGLKETSALDLRVRNALLNEPFKVSVIKADGKRAEYALRLIETPKPVEKAERRWNDLLSTQLRALTYFDRIERRLQESQQGVVIERVESGGHAGLAHLREGDLLVRVLDTPVSDIDSLERALASAQTQNAAKLSFLVMRGADTRLLFVESPWLAQ